jgi:hypothetical protein
MDTPSLLKEEINKTLEALHDFSKWKLLAASAIGLPGSTVQTGPNWLLAAVPFACAYVDLNSYQYLLRIFLLAKVLRQSEDDKILRQYESECEKYRARGYFNMGMFAQFGSSLIFSLILPGFALGRLILDNIAAWMVVTFVAAWVVGIAFLVVCDIKYRRSARLLEEQTK